MKRIITIILIIIAIAGIILLVGWMRARNTAQKNGTTAPSFRTFITGNTTNKNTGSTPSGDLTSDFTQETPSSTPTTNQTIGTRVSTFTNSSFNPASPQANGGVSSGGSGATAGNSSVGVGPATPTPPTGGGSTTVTTSGGGQSGGNTTPATPACSQADLNITFTPEELARLQSLQRRFYAVAQTLHTDADVATELGNHDSFKAKETKITELYNYCQSKVGAFTTPELRRRVATPFWNDAGQNTQGGFLSPTIYPSTSAPNTSTTLQSSITAGEGALEQILRINLW